MAPPPNYRQIATRQARRYGIPPAIFLRQIQQESGFNPSARSSAGAQGIAQFMPATARQYGVNTADPVSSLTGAAHLDADLIKKYGSVERALSAYNSGKPDAYKDPGFAKGQTYNYVRSIMGGQSGAGAVPSAAPAASPVNGALSQPQTPQPQQDPRRILQALSSVKGGDYTAFYQQLAQTSRQQTRPVPQPQVQGQAQPLVGAPIPKGLVNVSAGANRKGMTLQPVVENFVGRIAQTYGKPLTIGTGTNHNEYVAGTHRESDHWTGYAADIPASGEALTKLGQSALVAAGADPAWAAKQKGGLFNIGGKQVIFNSMEGGNHFNHLHVGIRTRK